MQSRKIYSLFKKLLFKNGVQPRIIKHGLFKGIKFYIDIQSELQFYWGLFEREIYYWVNKLSKRINTAIDIGVASGEYTIYFLVKTQAKKIFAFDPAQETQQSFFDNLKINNLNNNKRLKYYNKFVSDKITDNTMTLDSIKTQIEGPCLIKIDVDGGELDILKGATEFLKLSDCSWIIETHSKQLEEDCINILNIAQYKTIIVPNAWWRIIVPEQRPIEHNRWLVAFKD